MSSWNFFSRKKPDTEEARRERLLKTGRIAEGVIIDSDGASFEEISQVFYVYNVNGADYESSQILTAEQLQRPADYVPGARVSIRYDPRQPANSIVV